MYVPAESTPIGIVQCICLRDQMRFKEHKQKEIQKGAFEDERHPPTRTLYLYKQKMYTVIHSYCFYNDICPAPKWHVFNWQSLGQPEKFDVQYGVWLHRSRALALNGLGGTVGILLAWIADSGRWAREG